METITDGTTTITPELVLGYETAQEGRTIVHDILGRPDPDVSLAPTTTRAGTLELFFATADDAEQARVMHTQAAVFTYTATDNPTTSMRYVVAGGGLRVSLDDRTRRRWTVSVAYREVL